MYIEMELLARERYETRLREAEEMYRHRSLSGPPHARAGLPDTSLFRDCAGGNRNQASTRR